MIKIFKIKEANEQLYKHVEKTEKLLDEIYKELDTINYDDLYCVKETINKIVAKLDESEEVRFKE